MEKKQQKVLVYLAHSLRYGRFDRAAVQREAFYKAKSKEGAKPTPTSKI